jgi:hypothetical protein
MTPSVSHAGLATVGRGQLPAHQWSGPLPSPQQTRLMTEASKSLLHRQARSIQVGRREKIERDRSKPRQVATVLRNMRTGNTVLVEWSGARHKAMGAGGTSLHRTPLVMPGSLGPPRRCLKSARRRGAAAAGFQRNARTRDGPRHRGMASCARPYHPRSDRAGCVTASGVHSSRRRHPTSPSIRPSLCRASSTREVFRVQRANGKLSAHAGSTQ